MPLLVLLDHFSVWLCFEVKSIFSHKHNQSLQTPLPCFGHQGNLLQWFSSWEDERAKERESIQHLRRQDLKRLRIIPFPHSCWYGTGADGAIVSVIPFIWLPFHPEEWSSVQYIVPAPGLSIRCSRNSWSCLEIPGIWVCRCSVKP